MGKSFSLFPLFLAFGDFSILGQLMCLPLLINPRYQFAHFLITFLTSLAFIRSLVSLFLLLLFFRLIVDWQFVQRFSHCQSNNQVV